MLQKSKVKTIFYHIRQKYLHTLYTPSYFSIHPNHPYPLRQPPLVGEVHFSLDDFFSKLLVTFLATFHLATSIANDYSGKPPTTFQQTFSEINFSLLESLPKSQTIKVHYYHFKTIKVNFYKFGSFKQSILLF